MNKNLKKLSVAGLLGAAVLFSSIGDAQAVRPKSLKKRGARRSSSAKPMLLADKVQPEIDPVVLDSILVYLNKEMLGGDADLPGDEIYDSWNTEFVKAYAGVEIPDSFRIDVSSFVMPVKGYVTSPYGPRRKRFHYGTDLKLQMGDTIYAAFDGKVRVKQYEGKGYGYHLVLRHPNGLETVYGHLSGYLVGQNENVYAGQPIALGGSTGRSTGPHLHFEFRFLGQPINPSEIIDFDALCLKDDSYCYVKGQSERSYYTSAGEHYAADRYTTSNRYTKNYSTTNRYTASGQAKIKYHRVRKGDTLSSISRRYGVSVDKLRKINNMKTSHVRLGSSIRLS
ncbi:MAG: peptidoglycan DD-metalloendopeptidase family protein [Candidatus Azobacteroides sp.]|nr:peptidoglycan DD-metalloendopeptidase family protein [Candidatus Azobacteroides sp.]